MIEASKADDYMEKFGSIDELIAHVKKNFHMLIKFGTKENLEKLLNGQLYMKNILYYNTLENKDEEGKPDKYDGKIMWKDCSVVIKDSKNGETIAECSSPNVVLSYNIEKFPIFCLFCLDERNCENYILTENKCIVTFSFTIEQVEKLEKCLGKYALVILDTNEFFKRIDDAFKSQNIKYVGKLVSYNNGNSVERIQSIKRNKLNIAFNKELNFAYQQEFRFLTIDYEVEDNLILSIKDLNDIVKIFPTKQLVNFKIKLNCDFFKS